jgi:hypothetical protein
LPRTKIHGACGSSFAAGAKKSAFQRFQLYFAGTQFSPLQAASR